MIKRALWLLVPIAILGEAGHQVLSRIGSAAGHHAFHIAFGGGAVLVFAVFMLRDVRGNGWPSFSWRLRPHREIRER